MGGAETYGKVSSGNGGGLKALFACCSLWMESSSV